MIVFSTVFLSTLISKQKQLKTSGKFCFIDLETSLKTNQMFLAVIVSKWEYSIQWKKPEVSIIIRLETVGDQSCRVDIGNIAKSALSAPTRGSNDDQTCSFEIWTKKSPSSLKT